MPKKYLLIFFLVLQLLISTGVGITTSYVFDHNLAPYGLKVGNLNLEGIGKDEAWEEVEKIIPTKVEFKGQVYNLSTADSNKHIKNWLEKQFEYQGSSWLENVVEYIGKYKGEKILSDLLLKEEITPQLGMIKEKVDQPAHAAQFIDIDGQSVIRQGEAGFELDIENSWKKLTNSFTNQPVSLVVHSVNAHPNREELASVNQVLSSYTTFFDPRNTNKVINVRLAADSMNNTLLASGEEFSFNRIVGERTVEAGYKKARIFDGKKTILGEGGGICQDSSTLYQAVLRANLKILERHTHSLPVDYVPIGGDATVAYGVLDFRFKNDTNGYILIRAKSEDNWLQIQIIGSADLNHPAQGISEGYPTELMNKLKK